MKLKELASKLGLENRGDGGVEIFAPAPIEAAGPGMIVFVAGAKYASALQSNVSAAITTAELAEGAKCATLISSNPYADFARVLELFFPPYRPAAGIDPRAFIAPDATIGANASIGASAVIGAGVTLGRDAVIHPNVTIYPGVRIGDRFTAHSGVSIREGTVIGNRVTLLNGAVIGADGFGFVEENRDLIKIPQVGSVILEDDVEIGANSTVDRAMMGATILHRGVKLDGQVGCADHVTIGDRVMVVAKAGIHNDLKDDAIVSGIPAVDVRKFRRYAVVLTRLPEIIRRVRALESRVGIGGNET